MALTPLLALVRKDLKLFFSDRRAMIMSFAAPIAIASFFGSIFPGGAGSNEPARIPIRVVDEDGGAIAKSIVAGVEADKYLAAKVSSAEAARAAVRGGQATVAIVIPKGFGDAASRAFFVGQDKPRVDLWYDPSHRAEVGMIRGILTEHVMQAVSREVFTAASSRRYVDDALSRVDSLGLPAAQARALRDLLKSVQQFNDRADQSGLSTNRSRGFTLPFTTREEPVTARANVTYNGYAHSFAGMGVQFLLFAAIDLGIGILLERQRGLWKRVRSAPISRLTLLGGKAASGTLITLMTLLVSFGFAMLVFSVRIEGSVAGFLSVAVACALMASTFGLLIAALGNTPGTTRGLAIFAVLIMVMLGGAWVPTFIFPAWLQRLTVVVPARWAVDGLDAMTWRGLGLGGAVAPTLILLGFAALFGILAVTRFRWEEA